MTSILLLCLANQEAKAMGGGSVPDAPLPPPTNTRPDCSMSEANLPQAKEAFGRAILALVRPELSNRNLSMANDSKVDVQFLPTLSPSAQVLQVSYKAENGARIAIQAFNAWWYYENRSGLNYYLSTNTDETGRFRGCSVEIDKAYLDRFTIYNVDTDVAIANVHSNDIILPEQKIRVCTYADGNSPLICGNSSNEHLVKAGEEIQKINSSDTKASDAAIILNKVNPKKPAPLHKEEEQGLANNTASTQ